MSLVMYPAVSGAESSRNRSLISPLAVFSTNPAIPEPAPQKHDPKMGMRLSRAFICCSPLAAVDRRVRILLRGAFDEILRTTKHPLNAQPNRVALLAPRFARRVM